MTYFDTHSLTLALVYSISHTTFHTLTHSHTLTLTHPHISPLTHTLTLTQQTASPLSAIVFVDTEPNLCSSRIAQRSREGESGIPIEYLTNLHKFQTKWIDSTKIPVLRTLSQDGEKVDAFVAGVVRGAKEAVLLSASHNDTE
jgi:deoxyadenosine/deoxycytidine kinase